MTIYNTKALSKKGLIIFILFSIYISANGQQNIFSRVFNPYEKNYTYSIANALQLKGNNYIVISVGYDTLVNPKRNIQVCEIDSIGNLIKLTSYGSENSSYFAGSRGSFIKTHDGGYCIAGSKRLYSNYAEEHLILRFNSNMDTLWTKLYNSGINNEILNQLCQTSDKGFVCVGEKAYGTDSSDVLLFKTDSSGNFIWKKTIALGDNFIGTTILETPDKGLLISGYMFSDIEFNKSFVMKTDSIGNLIWYKILGSNKINSESSIAITNQGDYLVAYGYGIANDNSDSKMEKGRLNIIKYSADGYMLWNKILDSNRAYYSVYKINILSNNDIVVLGSSLGNGINALSPFLFRLNSYGDSLWRNTIYYSGNTLDNNYLFDDVINTDGSITACGYVRGDTLVPMRKIWVVRAYFNNPTNGIEEYYHLSKGEISIFPNPATTQTTITYPIAEKAITLQIYNMLGQKVYEEKLAKGNSQTTINITGFKPGLYKVVAGESSGTLIIN